MTVLMLNAEQRIKGAISSMEGNEGISFMDVDLDAAILPLIRAIGPEVLVLQVQESYVESLGICKMLSAENATDTILVDKNSKLSRRLKGLESGAVDYLSGDYAPEELLLRVRLAQRRRKGHGEALRIGQLTFYNDELLAQLNGVDMLLTRREYRILSALAFRKGAVLSREQLIELVVGDQADMIDRNIDKYINNIRLKSKVIVPSINLIRSVYGVGFTFDL